MIELQRKVDRLHDGDLVTSRIILLKLRKLLRENSIDVDATDAAVATDAATDADFIIKIFERIKSQAEFVDYQNILSFLAKHHYGNAEILRSLLMETFNKNRSKNENKNKNKSENKNKNENEIPREYQDYRPAEEWDPYNCLITEGDEESEKGSLIDAERSWLLEKLTPNLHDKSTFTIGRPMYIKILEKNADLFDYEIEDGSVFLIIKDKITPAMVAFLLRLWNDINHTDHQVVSTSLVPILILKKDQDKNSINFQYLHWLCTKLGLTMYVRTLSQGELYAYETISDDQRDAILQQLFDECIVNINAEYAEEFLNKQNIPFI
jgi:hypothetical protein